MIKKLAILVAISLPQLAMSMEDMSYNILNNQKLSSSIRNQRGYSLAQNLIEKRLSEGPEVGSVILGRKKALFYQGKINDMLANEFVNNEILSELKISVSRDLNEIRSDEERRAIRSPETTELNNHMMSMVLDFILTLD